MRLGLLWFCRNTRSRVHACARLRVDLPLPLWLAVDTHVEDIVCRLLCLGGSTYNKPLIASEFLQ